MHVVYVFPALTLCVLQDRNVLRMLARQAFQKGFHIKAVRQTRLFLVARGRLKELLVRVKQAGETSDKGGPNLLRVERCRTNQTDLESAPVVHQSLAGTASVHAVLRSLIAHGTDGLVIGRDHLEAVALNPARALGIVDGLRDRLRHDRRGCHRGLSIDGRCIGGARVVFRVQRGD